MSKIIGSTVVQKDDLYRTLLTDEQGILCTRPTLVGAPTQKILTTNGQGSGTTNYNGDYSSTPTEIYYRSTGIYDIYTLLITITDATTFNYTDYGAITAGTVTNGVVMGVTPSNGSIRYLFGGRAVINNYQWIERTEHSLLTTFSGTPQTLTIAFRLVEDYGMPLRLNNGDKFSIFLHDNFTGLVSHVFGLRGVYIPS